MSGSRRSIPTGGERPEQRPGLGPGQLRQPVPDRTGVGPRPNNGFVHHRRRLVANFGRRLKTLNPLRTLRRDPVPEAFRDIVDDQHVAAEGRQDRPQRAVADARAEHDRRHASRLGVSRQRQRQGDGAGDDVRRQPLRPHDDPFGPRRLTAASPVIRWRELGRGCSVASDAPAPRPAGGDACRHDAGGGAAPDGPGYRRAADGDVPARGVEGIGSRHRRDQRTVRRRVHHPADQVQLRGPGRCRWGRRRRDVDDDRARSLPPRPEWKA